MTLVWNYAEGQFPPDSLDASPNQWGTRYKKNPDTRDYTWRIKSDTTRTNTAYEPLLGVVARQSKVSIPNDLQLSGKPWKNLMDEMSIPGPGLASLADKNRFRVELTVDDGCSSETANVQIAFQCPDWPTAVLKVSSVPENPECDSTLSNVCTVYWNSYDLPTLNSPHGRFPEIKIDSTGSRNARSAPVAPLYDAAYTYQVGGVKSAPTNIPVTGSHLWRPESRTGTASYMVELETRHGPCRSAPDMKLVNTKCNVLNYNTPVSTEARWNSKRFDVACIDMRDLQYYRDNSQRSVGNYDSIRYEWSMQQAPTSSVYNSNIATKIEPDTRAGERTDIRCKKYEMTPTAGPAAGGTAVTLRFSSRCKSKLCEHDPWEGKLDDNLLNNLRIQFVTDTTTNGADTVRTLSAPITGIQLVSVAEQGTVDFNIENYNQTTPRAYRHFVVKFAAPAATKSIRDSSVRIQLISNGHETLKNGGTPNDICSTTEYPNGNPDDRECEDAVYIPWQYTGGSLFTPVSTTGCPEPVAACATDSSCKDTKYVETCTTHIKRTETKSEIKLMNHHYNKPYTCFRPDKAGDYLVQLTMDDGCTSKIENIPVRATCPPRIAGLRSKVKVDIQQGSTLSGLSDSIGFDGRAYARVFLDARSITTEADLLANQDVTFLWQMEGCPSKGYAEYSKQCRDKHKNANDCVADDECAWTGAVCMAKQITNEMGAKASFIPREIGTYNISLTVKDECNDPRTEYFIVSVNCSIPYRPASIDIYKKDLYNANSWIRQDYRRDSPPEVQWDTDKDGDCINTPEAPQVLKDRLCKQGNVCPPTQEDCGTDTCFPNYKKKISGTGCWGGNRFRFIARGSSTCSKTVNRWLIEDRTCARPFKDSAAPPPATVNSCTAAQYTCLWKLTSVPCGFDWSRSAEFLPMDCDTPTRAGLCTGEKIVDWDDDKKQTKCTAEKLAGTVDMNQCPHAGCKDAADPLKSMPRIGEAGCPFNPRQGVRATIACNGELNFKCRYPGTYKLQFSVNDGCSTARADTTIACQCATTPSVRAARTIYESLYTCSGASRRFAPVQIITNVTEMEGFVLQRCTAPTAATPSAPVRPSNSQCCPAASVCPQCPMCPQCPACPDVFARTTSNFGSSQRVLRPTTVSEILRESSRTFTESFSDASEVSYGPIMGVMLPMSALMLLSIFGNLFLISKISGRRNARKSKIANLV